MSEITNFNIRVYGLIINTNGEVLTSIEKYKKYTLHKFVGGGLEKGEGLKDGLQREFIEELNSEIEVKELFYVNDFFQLSFLKKEDQIISFYYFVSPKNWGNFETCCAKTHLNQRLIWTPLKSFKTELLSLPIDQIMIEKLKLWHKKNSDQTV
ncbi:MAG: NUDIX domain-containing protein [Crocinitomicaceae bacterium]